MNETMVLKENQVEESARVIRLSFEEFCDKTEKIKIIPEGEDISRHVGGDYFQKMKEGHIVRPLFGLYFPNEKEIGKIYAEIYMGWRKNNSNPVAFSNMFIGKIMKTLNVVNFHRDYNEPFEDVKKFIASRDRVELGAPSILDDVVGMMGQAYTGKSFGNGEILCSDIRIRAQKEFPESRVIYDFKPINMGYLGKAV